MSAATGDDPEDEDGLAKGEDAVVDSLLLLQVSQTWAQTQLITRGWCMHAACDKPCSNDDHHIRPYVT